MPDLESYEKRLEREAEKKAKRDQEKRDAAWRKHNNTMVTVGKMTEVLDRFHHVYVDPLQTKIDWLMLPFYKRWWGMAKVWVQDLKPRFKAWREKRAKMKADRALDRKVRKMERLDLKEADFEKATNALQEVDGYGPDTRS